MKRSFTACLMTIIVGASACSSGAPEDQDAEASGATGGAGESPLPKPPILGGDGLCAHSGERFVSTCEWAAAAKRIVWARVKNFEYLTEPSYTRIDEEPGWAFVEACERLYAAAALRLTILENLQGSGSAEVTVLFEPGVFGFFTFKRLADGSYKKERSESSDLAVGQEFGLALHQPDGSDRWFAPQEQFFPLDNEGKLAWPVDDECGLHMPEVLSGGTLEELREELDSCDGSNATPWREDTMTAEEALIYLGTARCLDSLAMGGAGGDSGAP